jgi:hypothetical protein
MSTDNDNTIVIDTTDWPDCIQLGEGQSLSFEGPAFMIADPPPEDILFQAPDGTEMLRISDDGFYVQGRKVEGDDPASDREIHAAVCAWLRSGGML